MKKKEEGQKRLLIKEYDLVCDLTDCKHCEEKDWCSEKDGMTRQEAIEKMAKEICWYSDANGCRPECGGCEGWKEHTNQAEAALNSLLEAE